MRQERPADGLRWNGGAWFGTQLGCTVWMLISAVLLAPKAPAVALGTLLGWVSSNALGLWLWRRRERVSALAAIQVLILGAGLASLAVVLMLDLTGWWYELGSGGHASPTSVYVMLAIMIPSLLATVRLQHRGSMRE